MTDYFDDDDFDFILIDSLRNRVRALEADNAALRQLLADMKPHWDGFTRKVIWTAQMAGVMADLRLRLDAALLAGKESVK